MTHAVSLCRRRWYGKTKKSLEMYVFLSFNFLNEECLHGKVKWNTINVSHTTGTALCVVQDLDMVNINRICHTKIRLILKR